MLTHFTFWSHNRGIEYKPGFGAKQVAWLVHSSVLGVVLAPMCLMGGPILMRAAMMTGGIVGGLSAIAVCAPSEKFLNMGGPLAIGEFNCSEIYKILMLCTKKVYFKSCFFRIGGRLCIIPW